MVATSFEELDCWKESRELVKLVFVACQAGQLSKDFGTSNQIKRASVSIMNNIAEGFGRKSAKEFVRFLDIAQSSALEVKRMTYICSDLAYLDEKQIVVIRDKTDKVKKIIRGLMRYLETKHAAPRT